MTKQSLGVLQQFCALRYCCRSVADALLLPDVALLCLLNRVG